MQQSKERGVTKVTGKCAKKRPRPAKTEPKFELILPNVQTERSKVAFVY